MKNSDAIKILKMVEAHGILTKEAKELAIKALESAREWIPVKNACRCQKQRFSFWQKGRLRLMKIV